MHMDKILCNMNIHSQSRQTKHLTLAAHAHTVKIGVLYKLTYHCSSQNHDSLTCRYMLHNDCLGMSLHFLDILALHKNKNNIH